jgi:hypothetical protein
MARTLIKTVGNPVIDDKGYLNTADSNGDPIQRSIGSDGQFLRALSSDATGLDWESILQVPSGGSTGQILTKTSGGYAWQTPAGGGMNYAGTVNVNLNYQQQYTVPSGRYFVGHANHGTSNNNSITIWLNTTQTNGNLGYSITASSPHRTFHLGNGNYLRQNALFVSNVNIAGYTISN